MKNIVDFLKILVYNENTKGEKYGKIACANKTCTGNYNRNVIVFCHAKSN